MAFMSLIIRSFNTYTHVSAESTHPDYATYLTRVDDEADEMGEKKYEEMWAYYNTKMSPKNTIKPIDIRDNTQTQINAFLFEVKNGRTTNLTFPFKFIDTRYRVYSIDVKVHTWKNDKNEIQFAIDRKHLTQELNGFGFDAPNEDRTSFINSCCNIIFTYKTENKFNSKFHNFSSRVNRKKMPLKLGKLPLANMTYKDDRITLPSIQGGFTHGVDEEKFQTYVYHCQGIKEADSMTLGKIKDIFMGRVNPEDNEKNNCADAVIGALEACVKPEINTKLKDLRDQTFLSIRSRKIRNPNIRLGQSVVSYTRAVREEILLTTINDKAIPASNKIQQVLRMEIMRLQDGIHNIEKNSWFKMFRQYSINQKKAKLAKLEGALKEISPYITETKAKLAELKVAQDKLKKSLQLKQKNQNIDTTQDTQALNKAIAALKEAKKNLETIQRAQLNALLKDPVIQSGMTRHETYDHLVALQNATRRPAQEAKNSPVYNSLVSSHRPISELTISIADAPKLNASGYKKG